MSVKSELDRISSNIASTYDILEGLGASMPSVKNSDNLPSTASTVPKGDNHYELFWDSYVVNRGSANYRFAFAGIGWNDNIFNPSITIRPTDARYMFQNSHITKLTRDQVSFDNCSELRDLFYASAIVEVEYLDATVPTNLGNMFYGCTALKKLTMKIDNKDTFASTTFNGCTELTDLIFEGTLAQAGLDLHWSPNLTATSLLSILNSASTSTPKSITFHSNSESVINNNPDCLARYNALLTAGWSISFSTP